MGFYAMNLYLVVDVSSPEASHGTVVRVSREEGGTTVATINLVEVLKDDLGLADGLAVVDAHGDLLVHRVGLEEELALVLEVLLEVLVAQTHEAES